MGWFMLASLALCFAPFFGTRSLPLQAKDEPPIIIPSRDLNFDLTILRRALEKLHPGLYRFNTREQMDANFATLEATFRRDLTREEAFLAISQFTAKIKCGHTYPNPNNQTELVVSELFTRQDKVPFFFRWIDGKMIITRDFSGDLRLKPGAEVLEINGTSTTAIHEKLMTIARADGSNDAKRMSLLQVEGTERYETFDVYFPMFFKQKSSAMELRVRVPPSDESVVLKVTALTYEQRLAPRKAREQALKGGDKPLWDLSFLNDDTASLSMPTWAVYDSKWDWTTFLNETFDTLAARGVANLIIDLRGNEGGSSVGDVILSRLVEKDLPHSAFRRLVRYRKTPDDLNPYLKTWDNSFKDWGDNAVGPTYGFYRLTKYDDDKGADGGDVIKPKGKRYGGRVFVLIGSANSSATFEFVRAVKEHGLGTLVGQPTGGNQRGINGGAFFFLHLPKSKIEVDLPLIGLFPKVGVQEPADTGVLPDIIVTPRADDIARSTDAEMEAVKRLIARGMEMPESATTDAEIQRLKMRWKARRWRGWRMRSAAQELHKQDVGVDSTSSVWLPAFPAKAH